ncbi:ribonuclease H-like domain-containing protein [Rhodococcus qingshengii]|uniref:ribonuclease H-like domain-containing protein n=1 Tax=Rhodococcus qingshengii TaxID=334542 RepID=UPI001C8B1883|nr:ribonuclease H-like domain-containing protein [Rhodococcus qingshengii]MBX9151980.1 hypothetical protein [Rhodococcus qingshengii]
MAESAAAGSYERSIIEAGNDFDRAARADGSPIVDDGGQPVPFAELLVSDRFVLSDRLFVNHTLRFRGIPDGINMASGRLEPLEIKNRTGYRESDLLELAFYWLLLQPNRTATDTEPAGWLQLSDGLGGRTSPLRVDIPVAAIAAVHELAARVREAIRDGIEPFWCRCPVCVQVTTPAMRGTAPLSVVNGIGPRHRRAFEAGGITTVTQLVTLPTSAVREALVTSGHMRIPSEKTIDSWKVHATAFLENIAGARAGNHARIPDRFIAFDMEYDPASPVVVWLLCAQTVGVDHPHRITIFADADHQGELIAQFADFLDQYPELPILTWNGTNADVSMLKKVILEYPIPAPIDVPRFMVRLESRHVDLYQWTRKAVSLPIPGLKLKDIASYFGVESDEAVGDGFAALMMWQGYRRTQEAAVRNQLIEYNRSDVVVLIEIARQLRAVHDGFAAERLPVCIGRDDAHVFETALSPPQPTAEEVPPKPLRYRLRVAAFRRKVGALFR